MKSLRIALLVAAVLAPGSPPSDAVTALPNDFVDELVVGGIDAPANSTFLPDGRLVVVGQWTASVRLIVDGAPASIDPAGTIPGVRSEGEAGLLGVAVDPGFPARPYIYLHATYTSPREIRITRYALIGDLDFTTDGAMALDMASLHTVLAGLPDSQGFHNGGTVRFGPDGMLYVGLGDDGLACHAQDLTRLQGKILRLDVSTLPDGPGGPPPLDAVTPIDNPFVGHADAKARLVWAYGLRNPFSFTIDPPTGCLWIGDVGEARYEEIDHACAGGMNFGWPHWEAGHRTTLNCAGADTISMAPPVHSYAHVNPGWAVFAGPLYRAPAGATDPYPASYEETYFYGDTWKSFIRRLEPSGTDWTPAGPVPGQPTADDWHTGVRYITSMHVGPLDGSLYYTMLYRVDPAPGPGEVRRIRYAPAPVGVGGRDLDVPNGAERLEFVGAWPSPARRAGPVELAWRQRAAGLVTLAIHDARGRCLRTLVTPAEGERLAGEHRVTWDGRDAVGRFAPAGVYVAKLQVQGTTRARRLVRL